MLDDGVGFEHTPGSPALPGSKRSGVRPRNPIAEHVAAVRQILLYLRMCEHPVVHRGTENDRSPGGEQRGGEQIVGAPLRRAGQQVRAGGSHDHRVSLATEPHVEGGPLSAEHVR